MLPTVKSSLWNQFGAGIDMLENIIVICPEDYLSSNRKFFYTAYHCILFLDYYLTIAPAKFTPLLPFSFTDAKNIPKDAIDDLVPDRIYNQSELLEYIKVIRIKCHDLIFSITEEKLQERWIVKPDEIAAGATLKFSVLDILLFNLRHVQHHVGQLNLLLRQTINKSPDWIAIAGKDKWNINYLNVTANFGNIRPRFHQNQLKIFAMFNYRLLLIRLKIHRIINPFNRLILKTGNFARLSSWIHQHKKLFYNDYYSPKGNYNDRYDLYKYILDNEISDLPVNYLEFGVADGETITWWANSMTNKNTTLYGFDTFEGLPEDWGIYKKGSFSNDGNIPVTTDERVKFYKGLFQHTLEDFLPELKNDRKNVILLDADLYSSTLFVLATIAPYLKKNDIIIFDEFLAPQHEFLAYYNFCEAFPHVKLEAFAAANNYSFVAFKIL